MDCIGWLSLHGYTMTFHDDGLSITPEDIPEYIVERLCELGPALEFLFPDHRRQVGRILGGK